MFWPGLHREVQIYVKDCFTCAAIKEQTPKVRTPQRHLLAFRPQEMLAIDFLKLDRGRGGFEDVLVMTDAFTKYAQAVPCRNQTAPVVAKALRDHWFSHYGTPLRIHSDRGRNFESGLIREICKLYGIEKTRTTPYISQGKAKLNVSTGPCVEWYDPSSLNIDTSGQNYLTIWCSYITVPLTRHRVLPLPTPLWT
ncbi:putative transposon Ty3-I Gag-Pol polyprotein [Apostichopus japonicus]|uniref:Putative transposon Ty3-I Gag-Pol polyprotein n=1 Tax=Stichopus japonicus TaxID=307972 RepID=A0A2G8JXR6_STIJA|nr:putative transposon Ty3-I Gag-Pol polyprotein [Apostichopus japonicus]